MREARFRFAQGMLLLAMAAALALCYRAGTFSTLQINQISIAALALFAVLACVQPEMALLFVPLVAPLYSIPLVLPRPPAPNLVLQLHELALVAITVAVAFRTLVQLPRVLARARVALHWTWLRRYAPALLLLVLAVGSVAWAVDRGQALRETRWLVVEPLLFYGLIHWTSLLSADGTSAARRWGVAGLLLAGALAGAFGVLQALGIDLVPQVFGFKATGGFTDNLVNDAGLARATSVYSHPNNLGLALERIWPLAAVLAVAAWNVVPRRAGLAVLHAVAALLCLAGIGVSVSRGAWLASGAAAAVLLWPFVRARLGRRTAPALLALALLLAVLGALAVSVRGSVAGGSTSVRLLLWQEALRYGAAHPFGLGMGQFYFYHNPEYGRSLIDPALIGTSEEFVSHPHDLVLDIWLRLGPLGLAVFSWLLWRFGRQVRAMLHARTEHTARLLALGLAAAMTAALVHGLVDNFYFVPDLAFSFWLLLALAEPPHAA